MIIIRFTISFHTKMFHYTAHVLISLIDIDKGNINWGIFADLQKAFDNVEHDILFAKLEHYGIRGLANEWFRSYLSSRKQCVELLAMNQILLLFYVV